MEHSFKDFTGESSKWLNKFIKDVCNDTQLLLRSVEKYPGNKKLVKEAILHGPKALSTKNPQDCKEMFNFIEFHATGSITPITVKKVK